MMYNIFINSHIVLSSVFFIVAFVIVGRSVYRLTKNSSDYIRVDRYLSLIYLALLYFQFITGAVLYYFIQNEMSPAAMDFNEAIVNARFRFWVVEHLATMIFALMLSQIGWIMIRSSSSSKKKFRNTLFYYGISLVIIVISTSIALIKEGIL